jgi:hypothetical protein
MFSRKRILIFIAFLSSITIYCQKSTRSITYERNKDKSITFNYNSDIPGSALVILNFTNLENAHAGIVKRTITGYIGEIYTLKPSNSEDGIGFSYRSRIIYGNVEKKPDAKFKYILPFKKGEKVKVRTLNYLGKKFGNTAPKNWKSWQFLTKPNDTIFAIRKGVVVNIKDNIAADTSSEYGYKSESNSITIEHKDGTLAKYDVLKDKSIMVNIGDIVYPSAPIALAGSYHLEENSQLRLSIFYLDEKILAYDFSKRENEKLSNKTHLYSYINPVFYLDDGTTKTLEPNLFYASTFNNSIIELEMRKREKRKWKKNGLLIKKR